ncbi:MAG: polymerase sporulation-specific sigma factor [Thermosediminibacterales bacterium]|nr:polymerase sporulation-specific sigma factor [Thermosediminibacterales bacterium]
MAGVKMNSDYTLALIKKSQQGDKKSKEKLIESNIGLVWNCVKKFQNRGYDTEDLFQIGCMGLIKAINKFDFNYDVKLSTYAVPMIIGEIRRFLRDNSTVKVSRALKETAVKVHKVKEALFKELGREPTISEISKKLKIPKEDVVVSLEASQSLISLNDVAFDDEGSPIHYIDQIGTDIKESEWVDKIALKEAISNFNSRERKIIILRYLKDMTQAQVAEVLGLSQVQISRIEKKVIQKLRDQFKK